MADDQRNDDVNDANDDELLSEADNDFSDNENDNMTILFDNPNKSK